MSDYSIIKHFITVISMNLARIMLLIVCLLNVFSLWVLHYASVKTIRSSVKSLKSLSPPIKSLNWFSLNVFPEFAEFSDKNTCHSSKGFKSVTSCVRDQDATTVPLRNMWERMFWLTLIHVIYQIPWIRWIHWIFVPFWENSNSSWFTTINTITCNRYPILIDYLVLSLF